jgi:hypothetical protein
MLQKGMNICEFYSLKGMRHSAIGIDMEHFGFWIYSTPLRVSCIYI